MLARVGASRAQELVGLEEMKAHLNLGADHRHHDALIAGLIEAAFAHLDGPRGILGRSILSQAWQLGEVGNLPMPYRLPLPGVSEVVVHEGTGDLEITRGPVWTHLRVTGDVGTIRFTAATPEDAHPAIAAALKLLVAHWYATREAATEDRLAAIPFGVTRLLSPLKVRWFG